MEENEKTELLPSVSGGKIQNLPKNVLSTEEKERIEESFLKKHEEPTNRHNRLRRVLSLQLLVRFCLKLTTSRKSKLLRPDLPYGPYGHGQGRKLYVMAPNLSLLDLNRGILG